MLDGGVGELPEDDEVLMELLLWFDEESLLPTAVPDDPDVKDAMELLESLLILPLNDDDDVLVPNDAVDVLVPE